MTRAPEQPADRTDQPQDVHVAGWVVGRAGAGIERPGSDPGQGRCPALEQAEVTGEALAGEEDQGQDEPERQPDAEQHEQGTVAAESAHVAPFVIVHWLGIGCRAHPESRPALLSTRLRDRLGPPGGRYTPAAVRMKSVPKPARRPIRSALVATIGTDIRRETAIISLNTKISAPAARPRKAIERSGATNE